MNFPHSPGRGSNNPNKRHVPTPQQAPQVDKGEVVGAYFGDDFIPAHDMVLAECLYIGQQGSVIIPDEVRQKQQTCRVIRTGPGRMTESGFIRPAPCKPDDYIFGMVGQGLQFMVGKKHLVLLNSSQVLGIFPTPPENIIESQKASEDAALKAKEDRDNATQPPPAE